ncbi:N-succinyldiaminopimelate aminotransferase [Corynebacterium kutscheri]|uniref:N-succinyldiaminopimelate aminotransferase n=1 Tax=Corynebacterium kutscheri TaxID=35755 RepID=A0A0F6R2L0_9CORY|nr:succinyldiaminopimelate transaminase [Corynebacterium kutscheri]AKE41723.1 succinyldiaminopimelate aminotransferase apoenzyme [Corynebacterium kutscheri]VEH08999.1 N-succinyldiaminopimelate aminotransferase [Corynebacterium kutscheri]VEH10050.1 N-succinyldiaminopimelate aminotransferase [Corynebacterium kutscheri]VEH80131.1 N-succinyldiaminopimelate aminotransferase [Corynebacterium kutscheri]
MRHSLRLPDFPWDTLEPAKNKAAKHPNGIVNLSVGSPVDDVAPGIQLALAENAAASGYPQTIGTPALRQAIIAAMQRRYACTVENVLPVIGTKEAIALLPSLLGCNATILIPEVAYPTYEVAALLAGATPQRLDDPRSSNGNEIDLIFINSPANPTGKVLDVEFLKELISWARSNDVIIASDECYLGLTWDKKAYSILSDEVSGGDHRNLIAIHSLSKTSNLASYRAGFLAGDKDLINELTQLRKHSGLMVPGPVQAAMAYALDDDEQELFQKQRYQLRRRALYDAVLGAGFTVHDSEAGLYLWLTRDEDCWDTVDWFAERGILVAPGSFYGTASQKFVRIALTETDERIAEFVRRIA